MKARKNPGKSSDGYGKNMGDIKNNETPFNDEVGLLLQPTGDHLPLHSNHIICMPIMDSAPANFHLIPWRQTLFTISSTRKLSYSLFSFWP